MDLSKALDLASLGASHAAPGAAAGPAEHKNGADTSVEAAAGSALASKAPPAPKAQRSVRMNVPDDAPVLHRYEVER